MHSERFGRVHARDHGAPESPSDFAAGLPGPIAEGLNREIRKAVHSNLMRERLAPDGFEFPDYNLSQTLEYVRSETGRWQPIAGTSAARND